MNQAATDTSLKLVIFDFDGTLMDSGDLIVRLFQDAFAAEGLPPPADRAIRRVIGLNIPDCMERLGHDLSAPRRAALGAHFLEALKVLRRGEDAGPEAPLYPGAIRCLDRLDAAGRLLSIATGKDRWGLNYALSAHGLEKRFLATQTVSDAPGKPHPGMVENCLSALGVAAADAVMVGDTSYDMAMAANAGVAAIGVSWGYHEPEDLLSAGAIAVASDFDDLIARLDAHWTPAEGRERTSETTP